MKFHTLSELKNCLSGTLIVLAALFALQAQATLDVMTDGVKPGEWTMDLEAAKTYAQENNMPLFMNFTGSDWCGWCKLMDKNVFSDPEWSKFAEKNLVLVTIDFPQDESIVPEKYKARNVQLQQKYGVEGYPTYLIMSPDMTVLGKLGAGEDKDYESFSREVASVLKYTDAQVEAFAAKLEAEVAKEYKQALERMRATELEMSEWIGSQPEDTQETFQKYMAYQKKVRDARHALRQIEVNYQADQLPAEDANAYKAAYEQLVTAESKLDSWLMTMPERNQENQETFMEMQKQISELQQKIAQYEMRNDG